jgi:mitogen-activated protein kinase kinase
MATPPELPPTAPEDSRDFAEAPRTPGELTDSEDESPAGSPSPDTSNTLRLPSLRPTSDSQTTPSMTASSTPLGLLQNARRPVPSPASSMRGPQRTTGGALPESVEAKMRAFHLSRQGTPPSRPQIGQSVSAGSGPMSIQPGMAGGGIPGFPAGFRMPPNAMRPQAHNFVSAPAVPKMGLSARRKMQLPGGLPGGLPGADSSTPNLNANGDAQQSKKPDNAFDKFSQYIDTQKGELKFAGKAVINSEGVTFSTGSSFSISLDEVDTLEELGKGNYGTVYKVRHARPKMRRPGLGLAGNKASSFSPITPSPDKNSALDGSAKNGTGTGVIMAMKELRLELEEAKFAAIIMELDILHRCLSPYIIDFYGCFFQEGAVYICIEFMDGGSVDKLYGDGVPEGVLRKITYATTQGLKTLKDDHNIIHRDVKPTNILVNTRGQVKICDFGVSGNLVASMARTNIGCQSYMAPERISGKPAAQPGATAPGGSYSVQSDIWSLGLSIIECAMGRYPYPPETYNSIFSQLAVSR